MLTMSSRDGTGPGSGFSCPSLMPLSPIKMAWFSYSTSELTPHCLSLLSLEEFQIFPSLNSLSQEGENVPRGNGAWVVKGEGCQSSWPLSQLPAALRQKLGLLGAPKGADSCKMGIILQVPQADDSRRVSLQVLPLGVVRSLK